MTKATISMGLRLQLPHIGPLSRGKRRRCAPTCRRRASMHITWQAVPIERTAPQRTPAPEEAGPDLVPRHESHRWQARAGRSPGAAWTRQHGGRAPWVDTELDAVGACHGTAGGCPGYVSGRASVSSGSSGEAALHVRARRGRR